MVLNTVDYRVFVLCLLSGTLKEFGQWTKSTYLVILSKNMFLHYFLHWSPSR
jgi:hypothetical protein